LLTDKAYHVMLPAINQLWPDKNLYLLLDELLQMLYKIAYV